MNIHIQGVFELDPFGIPMLKHNSNVDFTQAIGTSASRLNIPVGPLTLGAAVDVEPDATDPKSEDVDLDIKLALANFPVYDLKETLAHHVGLGSVNIGSKQLGFIGTITVTE